MGHRVHEGGEEIVTSIGSKPIKALAIIGKPSLYVMGGLNAQGKTDYAAVGLRWKVDVTKHLYLRAGVGMAVNNGPLKLEPGRIWEGSNANFEPEFNIGWKLTRSVALEASYIHMSQARLFSERNPGMNELGIRAVVKFDGADVVRRIRDAF